MVARARLMQKAQTVLQGAMDRLDGLDLTEDEIRRLVENELAFRRANKKRKKHA
jgi:predicted metal-dependent hydrolase